MSGYSALPGATAEAEACSQPMHVVVVTHIPSPYQVELFNAVAALDDLDVHVLYLHRVSRSRQWQERSLRHNAVYLDEEERPFRASQASILGADLAVFNYYAAQPAGRLLDVRARSGKPWCFWGERPGFRKPEWMGRLRRRYALAWLHRSRAPIWALVAWPCSSTRRNLARSAPIATCHTSLTSSASNRLLDWRDATDANGFFSIPVRSSIAKAWICSDVLFCVWRRSCPTPA